MPTGGTVEPAGPVKDPKKYHLFSVLASENFQETGQSH
jgi:hypothetical protein